MIGIGINISSRLQASAFNPSTISGLRLWLKSDTGVLNSSDAAASNGQGVKTWQDQSGNGYHLSQSTAGLRPIYTTATTFNGYPLISFDGTDDYLITTTGTIQTSPGTTFMVWRNLNSAVDSSIIISGGSANGQLFFENGDVVANTTVNMLMGAGANVNNQVYTYGTTYYTTLIYNGANSFHRRSGTSVGAANAGTSTANGISIGALRTGGDPFQGFIAEILVYNSALSAANYGAVESYLAAKYGA